MKFKTPGILLTVILMVAALIFVSCGDDDSGPNCSKLEQQIGDISDDYYDAVFNEDCEDLDELYDQLVAKYKQAKSCKAFKEALEDLDMTYDEYMQELEDEHEDFVDSCGDL